VPPSSPGSNGSTRSGPRLPQALMKRRRKARRYGAEACAHRHSRCGRRISSAGASRYDDEERKSVPRTAFREMCLVCAGTRSRPPAAMPASHPCDRLRSATRVRLGVGSGSIDLTHFA
jgi:hypothetical protein